MLRSSRGHHSRRLPSWVWALAVGIGWSIVLTGCVSRPTLTVSHDDAPADSTLGKPPAGCRETMCDYYHRLCANPCSECWSNCELQEDQVAVITCSQTCNETCAAQTSKPPDLAACAAAR